MELKSLCRLIYKQQLSQCHIVFHIVIHAILKPNHIAFFFCVCLNLTKPCTVKQHCKLEKNTYIYISLLPKCDILFCFFKAVLGNIIQGLIRFRKT